jgi:hypothetical protein
MVVAPDTVTVEPFGDTGVPPSGWIVVTQIVAVVPLDVTLLQTSANAPEGQQRKTIAIPGTMVRSRSRVIIYVSHSDQRRATSRLSGRPVGVCGSVTPSHTRAASDEM